MWKFLELVFGWMSNLASGQLATLIKGQESLTKGQEKIVANIEQLKADLAAINENLEETRGDLKRVLTINTQQSGQITSLEAAVDALKVELAGKIADLSQVDVIAGLVAEIRGSSREVADIVEPEPVPVPTPEPPAVEPAPEPAPPEAA